MQLLTDTHAHILDEQFQDDLTDVLFRIQREMAYVVNIGCNFNDIESTITLAEHYPFLYAGIGLHPEDVTSYNEEKWQTLCELAKHPKVVGIGETGLDYYWDASTKEAQKTLFQQHIDLACQLNKPLIVHDRDAHGDTLDILIHSNAPSVGGIIHAFSGSVEMAMELIKKDFMIGLGGALTFKNAKKSVEVAKKIPLDHIVIETDCPYMTPVPFRGKRNEPIMTKYVAEKLAEIKQISVEEVLLQTYENGKKVYHIE